jgi:hypothetical protein
MVSFYQPGWDIYGPWQADSCLSFDDADGVEGLEFVQGDAKGMGAVVEFFKFLAKSGKGSLPLVLFQGSVDLFFNVNGRGHAEKRIKTEGRRSRLSSADCAGVQGFSGSRRGIYVPMTDRRGRAGWISREWGKSGWQPLPLFEVAVREE